MLESYRGSGKHLVSLGPATPRIRHNMAIVATLVHTHLVHTHLVHMDSTQRLMVVTSSSNNLVTHS
jgi:hypothetical protein